MDLIQTIFKTNIFLSSIYEALYDKGLEVPSSISLTYYLRLKTPEFDKTYDPVVRKPKDMQKTPEFDTTYVPIVMNQKWDKKLQNLTQQMTL